VPATTASATPACAARADTAPSTSAPPELAADDDLSELPELAAAGELVVVPEFVLLVVPDPPTSRGVLPPGVLVDATEEVVEVPALETGVTVLAFEPTALPPGK
jgi:hypothetical protein